MSRDPLSALDAVRDPDALATAIRAAGVAPRVAVGAARRSGTGWGEVCGGDTNLFFDLASVTKPCTAIVAARGGIGRDTPLGELLEEARGAPTERAPLELLLAHRAGLDAHAPLFSPLLSGGGVDVSASLREAARAVREDCAGPRPAEGYAPLYSDLGYLLAGEALARGLGVRDAGDAHRALVAEPLGLSRELGTARELEGALGESAFLARVAPTEHVPFRGGEVRGRVHDENAFAVAGAGGAGHAGLFGTVSATLALGRALLDWVTLGRGPLASRVTGGAAESAWMVRERPGGTLRAGFDGKSAEGSSAGALAGPRTFGHLGFTGTSLWIDPDREAVVVVLTNRVCPTRDNVAIRAARPRAHDALFRLAEEL